jgi:glycosyltransferase involved in cell wall biosynthesis
VNVSVLVCTYGSREWALRGATTAKNVQGAHEVIALHENDGTLAGVRNLAASAASGDFLCFLDADDELGDGYLAAMVTAWEKLRQPGQMIRTESGPRPLREGELVPETLLVPAVSFIGPNGCTDPAVPAWNRSIYDVNCAVIGTLVRRLVFARVGGFEEWSAYEDWDLWLRCIADGARLVPVPEAVYCARAEDGTGRNTAADHRATYDAIRARHAGVAPAVWEGAKR